MSILDFFKVTTRQPLLLDERLESLKDAIRMDLSCYNASENKRVYALSSHAVTLTFSKKKVLKSVGLNIDNADPDHLHREVTSILKKYVAKCIKKISCILYVDYGSKDFRYHLHGYHYGDKKDIVKLLNYARRNFGFAHSKEIFDFEEWAIYAAKNNASHIPIMLYKDKR